MFVSRMCFVFVRLWVSVDLGSLEWSGATPVLDQIMFLACLPIRRSECKDDDDDKDDDHLTKELRSALQKDHAINFGLLVFQTEIRVDV